MPITGEGPSPPSSLAAVTARCPYSIVVDASPMPKQSRICSFATSTTSAGAWSRSKRAAKSASVSDTVPVSDAVPGCRRAAGLTAVLMQKLPMECGPPADFRPPAARIL